MPLRELGGVRLDFVPARMTPDDLPTPYLATLPIVIGGPSSDFMGRWSGLSVAYLAGGADGSRSMAATARAGGVVP